MFEELLKRKANGEQLTEQEEAILKAYTDMVELNKSKVEALEAEKLAKEEEAKARLSALEDLTKKVEEKENKLKEIEEEKIKIETILKNAEDKNKALSEIEKIRLEAEKKEALAKLNAEREAERLKQKKEEEEKLELVKKAMKEVEELKEKNNIMQFKFELAKEKAERPYFANQLDKISNEVEVKGYAQSKMILEFLLGSVNHEEELKKFNERKREGSSIFEGSGKESFKEERKVDEKYGTLNVELAKKLGYIPS